MGSTADPSPLGTLLAILCVLPWFILVVIAVRDKPRKQHQAPYREIRERHMSDERAGFVEVKMQKIERAMK